VTDRNVRNLLDAVNVAGKGSNEDAPFRNVEIVFERFADIPFALRVSRLSRWFCRSSARARRARRKAQSG
jgi:hypothetical protein